MYDCARLCRDLGVSRKAAEAIMLRLPKQHVPGVRKTYVRGTDVKKLLDDNLVDITVSAPLGRVA